MPTFPVRSFDTAAYLCVAYVGAIFLAMPLCGNDMLRFLLWMPPLLALAAFAVRNGMQASWQEMIGGAMLVPVLPMLAFNDGRMNGWQLVYGYALYVSASLTGVYLLPLFDAGLREEGGGSLAIPQVPVVMTALASAGLSVVCLLRWQGGWEGIVWLCAVGGSLGLGVVLAVMNRLRESAVVGSVAALTIWFFFVVLAVMPWFR